MGMSFMLFPFSLFNESHVNLSPHAFLIALCRARAPILWIGLTHLLGVVVGIGMVHAHNSFALRSRDDLVGRAIKSDPIMISMLQGHALRAAFADFAGNLIVGAAPSTVMGLSVVLPFPWVAYRGWIGGIVSVDDAHFSRLRDRGERIYYLGVLLLQLIPYTLAGGTGVRLGLAFLFPKGRWGYEAGERWLGLPAEGVRDVCRIYVWIVPLFLIASIIEFLAR
jgi:uncharacterized membrane protein SpoIIM required for sporulation